MRPPVRLDRGHARPEGGFVDLQPPALAEGLSSPQAGQVEGVTAEARDQDLHVRDVEIQDARQRPDVQEPARPEDGHAVAEGLRVGEDVGREEHGLARLLEVQDDVPDQPAADGIEPGHRLVEDDELGIVDQGLGDSRPLHHPLREAADGGVGGSSKAHEVEKVLSALPPLPRAEAEQAAGVVQVFARREVVVEIGMLGKVTHLVPPGGVSLSMPEDGEGAAVRMEETRDDLQGRGLTRAVGPEVAEDLPGSNLEVQVREDGDGPLSQVPDGVALGEPRGDQRQGRGGRSHAARRAYQATEARCNRAASARVLRGAHSFRRGCSRSLHCSPPRSHARPSAPG